MYGIAINVARNKRRSKRRYEAALARYQAPEPVSDPTDDIVERVAAEQKMADIWVLMGHLSRTHQEIIELCDWSGLSHEDASVALNVPVGTVKSRHNRARSQLQALVARNDKDVRPVNSGV